MQFEIECKQCHKKFAIEASAGQTLKCSCPYCNAQILVATPLATGQQTTPGQAGIPSDSESFAIENTQQRKGGASLRTSRLGMKVTVIFIVLAILLLLAAIGLYIVFSLMSN